MDCNREEAVRAKEMAEDLMAKKDFSGARKLVIRAQKLCSDLENVSQMLMVCDVHCAAAVKLSGNETDWYAILQIDVKADEVTIKKQYRKFALLLHPDKNKFHGAESAFKLIGEAQRTLLDKGKRSLHDRKRKAFVRAPAQASFYHPQQAQHRTTCASTGSHTVKNKFTGWKPQNQHPQHGVQAQPGVSGAGQTFLAACPCCFMSYQYNREAIKKLVNCKNCGITFTALEYTTQTGFSFTQPVRSQSQSNVERSFPTRGCKDNSDTKNVGAKKAGEKRKRKKADDSSESSSDSEENIVIDENEEIEGGQDSGSFAGRQPRRSGRSKRHVSYDENVDDDVEFVNPTENSMENGMANGEEASEIGKQPDVTSYSEETAPNGTMKKEKTDREGKDESGACKTNCEVHNLETESSSEEEAEENISEYPDPDFSDFDKLKEEAGFVAGQIWAIYDPSDGMPRFYAEIKRVFKVFKLRIRWLEPEPWVEKEIRWQEENLPISCGNFVPGDTIDTEDRLTFSHLIQCEKGTRRDPYRIIPRKGETWALFKNWDINWFEDPEPHRNFQYEFVEVLDHSEEAGISVAYLYKVKGFSCVFGRMVKDGTDIFQILPSELLRFSHRVPSVKLTGKEGKGAPKGFYELDPASLPSNIEEWIESPPDVEDESMDSSDEKKEDCSAPSGLNPESIEIPEAEFYNFDGDKSKENFKSGQIWSVYCEEDGLPKYYACIRKVELKPEFKVHFNWLEPLPLPDNVKQWRDKEMPICCGTFKVNKRKSETYSSEELFSHELKHIPSGMRKNECSIYPRNGDVWALYKNWSTELKSSELENCEYDVVEVSHVNDDHIEVVVLEREVGFSSVFKAATKEGFPLKWRIPREDLLRFSHQVPAYRLSEERGGRLRGFLELDSAALPVKCFPH